MATLPSMEEKRDGLVDQIAVAMVGIQEGIKYNDSKEIIDWAVTVQLVTAELMATCMTRIMNR